MLDFCADEGIVAEIEMALLAVMQEGDSIPTMEGWARAFVLDEGGVRRVQVLRRWHSDHQACLHFGLAKKTE